MSPENQWLEDVFNVFPIQIVPFYGTNSVSFRGRKPSFGVSLNHTESGPIWAEVFCEWPRKMRRLWDSRFGSNEKKHGNSRCCFDFFYGNLKGWDPWWFLFRRSQFVWKLYKYYMSFYSQPTMSLVVQGWGLFLCRYMGPRKKPVQKWL